ncbi:hypothetical protein [Olivibacter sp. XZL3]|uniref:LpxL/LpxP family acyltransferase n=1 Tax=Olivibacter sp. XZL3 TaxID=1735116 RepID=UPI0010655C9C|nr:hypothetical protein [Olivibacter sp. XZL3]
MIKQYRIEKAIIEERYDSFSLAKANDRTLYHYAFFSANLHRFLPHIPWHEHARLFKEMALNQSLSLLDMQYATVFADNTLQTAVENLRDQLQAQPGIVVTFHTGSYRLLNFLLTKAGVPISLVVSKHTYMKEGEAFREAFRKLGNGTGHFDLIVAEQPQALLRMVRSLKDGNNLLLYMDGNTGMRARLNQLEEISWFGKPLFVRRGVPYLAHAAQVPIYPVLSERGATGVDLLILSKIDPAGFVQRTAFIAETCQHLYALLEAVLQKQPEQWTCWPYIHRNLGPSISGNPLSEPENQLSCWSVFKFGSDCYLFDKINYQFFMITSEMYKDCVEMCL